MTTEATTAGEGPGSVTGYLADFFMLANSRSRSVREASSDLRGNADAFDSVTDFSFALDELHAALAPQLLEHARSLSNSIPGKLAAPVLCDIENDAIDEFLRSVFEAAGIGADFQGGHVRRCDRCVCQGGQRRSIETSSLDFPSG